MRLCGSTLEKNIESYHVKTWRTAMEDVTHGKADYAVTSY